MPQRLLDMDANLIKFQHSHKHSPRKCLHDGVIPSLILRGKCYRNEPRSLEATLHHLLPFWQNIKQAKWSRKTERWEQKSQWKPTRLLLLETEKSQAATRNSHWFLSATHRHLKKKERPNVTKSEGVWAHFHWRNWVEKKLHTFIFSAQKSPMFGRHRRCEFRWFYAVTSPRFSRFPLADD